VIAFIHRKRTPLDTHSVVSIAAVVITQAVARGLVPLGLLIHPT
jgi:hypothetical protein